MVFNHREKRSRCNGYYDDCPALNALKRGMRLRFTGDIIAMAPPVITTQDELDRMFNAVGEAIRAVA